MQRFAKKLTRKKEFRLDRKMAGNGDTYTTTTFSIFPDLLPPPGPGLEFSAPVRTNRQPTGAEMWMRFRSSFNQVHVVSKYPIYKVN